MRLFLFVLAVMFNGSFATTDELKSANCDTYKTCLSCTSGKTWTSSNCRWCPSTNDCHAEGSLENKCSSDEQITSKDNCPVGPSNDPEQIHIALYGDVGMTISWVTRENTNTTVLYGTSETQLDMKAGGDSAKQLLANWYHHVSIDNLKQDTTYYYSCGNGDNFSPVYSFRTAKSASSGFVASVFGDWGYGENGNAITTRNALDKIIKDVDFVFHLGDIAYADDAFLHDITGFEYVIRSISSSKNTPKQMNALKIYDRYENIYDSWMNWIQNITAYKPYMVAVGNHESECHAPSCITSKEHREALQNFSAFNARWDMPFEKSGSRSNMWYSYDYGLAHFVAINTETDFPKAPEFSHGDSGLLPAGGFGRDEKEYLEWLEADLKAANASRDVRPWIFAGGHRQMYDTENSINVELQNAVEDLFQKYGVDVFFSGHKHSYTRMYPVYRSQVSTTYVRPNATAYVIVGGAGCDEMKISNDLTFTASSPWEVFHDGSHYGTGRLTVFNRTHMKWEYILSHDLSVADSFVLVK